MGNFFFFFVVVVGGAVIGATEQRWSVVEASVGRARWLGSCCGASKTWGGEYRQRGGPEERRVVAAIDGDMEARNT